MYILANITKDKHLIQLLLDNQDKDSFLNVKEQLLSLGLLHADLSTSVKQLLVPEDQACKLIEAFDPELFLSFRASVQDIYKQYLTDKTIPTILNLPLTTVLDSNDFSTSKWNMLVSEVKHQLVCGETLYLVQ